MENVLDATRNPHISLEKQQIRLGQTWVLAELLRLTRRYQKSNGRTAIRP
jgi:hypothetical protein